MPKRPRLNVLKLKKGDKVVAIKYPSSKGTVVSKVQADGGFISKFTYKGKKHIMITNAKYWKRVR